LRPNMISVPLVYRMNFASMCIGTES
jgi:hypothetical protein